MKLFLFSLLSLCDDAESIKITGTSHKVYIYFHCYHIENAPHHDNSTRLMDVDLAGPIVKPVHQTLVFGLVSEFSA